MVEKYKNISFAPLTILCLLIIATYFFTNAPSVVQIDSGELATVQILPGVAHPTGYPVFTLLGYLFSKLFFFSRNKIELLNMLASVYVMLALFFFCKTAKLILEDTEKDEKMRKLYAVSATGLLAFSRTYWTQSVSVEVYSLHLFLTSVVIFRLILAFRTNTLRDWLFFSVALAVSFGNHMTTIMLIPAAGYLYFYKNNFGMKSFVRIAEMLAVFIPVVVLEYYFLVLLANASPKLNWGNVITFENLLRHISGKQYQVWMFSGWEVAKKQFFYFLSNLPKEFAYIGLLPPIFGIGALKKESKPYFIFFSLLFVSVLAYAVNYDIHDIDSYFLLAYVSLAYFSVFGIRSLARSIQGKIPEKVLVFAVFVFAVAEVTMSFANVNQSDNHVFEDYTKSALASVEKNSVVITYQWDYFVSPSYYFRYVENYRSDVAVVDKELLRRSWYYKQLGHNFPFVFEGLEDEVDSFLRALAPFESGGNFDPALLEKLYRSVISGIITENIDKRDVYIAPELVDNELKKGEFSLPEGCWLVPCDYFFKVVPEKKYYDCPIRSLNIRFDDAPDDYYVRKVKQLVKTMLVRRAFYEMQFGRNDKARRIVEIFKEKFPDSGLPSVFKKLY